MRSNAYLEAHSDQKQTSNDSFSTNQMLPSKFGNNGWNVTADAGSEMTSSPPGDQDHLILSQDNATLGHNHSLRLIEKNSLPVPRSLQRSEDVSGQIQLRIKPLACEKDE